MSVGDTPIFLMTSSSGKQAVVGAYLRVVAGFFAAVFVWVGFTLLFRGGIGGGVADLLIGSGLWYLALAKPIRERRAWYAEQRAALVARADADNAAFLAGRPDPLPVPAEKAEPPRMRKGVRIAIGVATALFVLCAVANLTTPDATAAGAATTIEHN